MSKPTKDDSPKTQSKRFLGFIRSGRSNTIRKPKSVAIISKPEASNSTLPTGQKGLAKRTKSDKEIKVPSATTHPPIKMVIPNENNTAFKPTPQECITSNVNLPKTSPSEHNSVTSTREKSSQQISPNNASILLNPETPLENQPYFHGILPREEINYFLTKQGDFIVRQSKHKDSLDYVLSVFWEKLPRHFILVESKDGSGWKLEQHKFATIPQLIYHYFTNKLPLTERTQARLLKLVERESWLLNNDDIRKESLIGKGNFGEVWKGTYTSPYKNEPEKVAIKLCHDSMDPIEKKKFISEARIMRRYNHCNIVRLFGVAASKEPMMIILELVNGGSLDSYLQTHKGETDAEMKLKYTIDGARGMEYLERKNCIHRDLAARNCLIDSQSKTVKIGDFGLSREGVAYEMTNKNRPMPIKWIPPETLENHIYTHHSDVWSFGILIWEIYSDADEPYSDMTNKQAYSFLKKGKRLGPPSDMQPSINTVMQSCWESDPEKRPKFCEIRKQLELARQPSIQPIIQTTMS